MKRNDNQQTIVLASGSPRRRALLARAGFTFEVVESGIDEQRDADETAGQFALRMACEKALAVAGLRPSSLVLAADTVVECAGQILGKPATIQGARAMLFTLSGTTHVVTTAYALVKGEEVLESRKVSSRVRFRQLGAAEVEAYIATGEPFDKAGGYGIQDKAGGFVASVEGSIDNVTGLPVAEVTATLARFGIELRNKGEATGGAEGGVISQRHVP